MSTDSTTTETSPTVGQLAIATAALDASARRLEQEFSAVKTEIIANLRTELDYLRAELSRERSIRVDAVAALRAATAASL